VRVVAARLLGGLVAMVVEAVAISAARLARQQRPADQWRKVVFIEPAPPGNEKLTALTLFVTNGDVEPKHESEPSFCLASLAIGPDKYAQLIAHAEPEGKIPKIIERRRAEARLRVQPLPAEAYMYVLGHWEDGSRFLVGARATR
jgi:hypothetical protein